MKGWVHVAAIIVFVAHYARGYVWCWMSTCRAKHERKRGLLQQQSNKGMNKGKKKRCGRSR